MFQSFSAATTDHDPAPRLAGLRKAMREAGFDWWIVPHADAHQNEYLPACAERLAWLTGFTGSAGLALIGREQAHIFSDGRYQVQLRRQTDRDFFTLHDSTEEPPERFLGKQVDTGEKVGFDPWLMTIAEERKWRKALEAAGATLVPGTNPIDGLWTDRPPPPRGTVKLQPIEHAGETAASKLVRIREKLAAEKADALLLTDPASLAWTFNIRGNDVAHNPVPLGFAIIPADEARKPTLFMAAEKLSKDVRAELEKMAEIGEPAALETRLKADAKGIAIHVDPALVASHLGKLIAEHGGRLVEKSDPAIEMRAVKNETELAGSRAAHLRDGVAMTRFLAWLDRQPWGSVDEISAAKQLESCRRETASTMNSQLLEIAFDTISGAGGNGAMIHYRVDENSNTRLAGGTLYLIDSGGQYADGTTDITRTVAIGDPPAGAVTDFTLVLKGHIAIATVRFPEKTRGIDIDALARLALWRHGKDYGHGTGHGVGAYLNVHEGPQSISRRGLAELRPGMIVSNEPGYYRENEYGIRIENLMIVTPPTPIEAGDKPMLGFETVTLAPIDRRLIDTGLMLPDEIAWLDAYHEWVRDSLSPHLGEADRSWLQEATRALG